MVWPGHPLHGASDAGRPVGAGAFVQRSPATATHGEGTGCRGWRDGRGGHGWLGGLLVCWGK